MSLYKFFGFKENIFNTRPLLANEQDAKKFIGRVEPIKSFMVDISTDDRALVLVTGQKGVGKTSFVNIMEYACSNHEMNFESDPIKENALLPCHHKVQIDPDDTIQDLLFKCTSSLIFSLKLECGQRKINYPESLKSLTTWVSEVAPISSNLSLNLGPVGLGGGTNKQMRSINDIPPESYCKNITQIVDEAKEILKIKGMFLNINNLEIVSEDKFLSLINHLRDYLFEINSLRIILIGYPGMYSTLSTKVTRVAEIINGQETLLDAMTIDDVINVLNHRREIFSMNNQQQLDIPNIADHPKLPIEESFIRNIYSSSSGEIRSIFKACDDIVRAVFKENPSTGIIQENIGKAYLKLILERQIGINNLGKKDQKIISKIIERQSIRPRDFLELSLKSPNDFINKTRHLIEKNILVKKISGNSAEYMISGTTQLALYCGVSFSSK